VKDKMVEDQSCCLRTAASVNRMMRLVNGIEENCVYYQRDYLPEISGKSEVGSGNSCSIQGGPKKVSHYRES